MASLHNVPEDAVLAKMPFVHNAYIAGYLGYLGLEQLRANQFSKESAYATAVTRDEGAYCRTLNVASNFMFQKLIATINPYEH